MKHRGPVDPLTVSTLLAGALFGPNRIQGDRITMAGGQIEFRPPENSRWLTSERVGVLVRKQQALMLYVEHSGSTAAVYDIGIPTPIEACGGRLRAQYMLDDGSCPQGYEETALVARRWQAPNRVVLLFETVC